MLIYDMRVEFLIHFLIVFFSNNIIIIIKGVKYVRSNSINNDVNSVQNYTPTNKTVLSVLQVGDDCIVDANLGSNNNQMDIQIGSISNVATQSRYIFIETFISTYLCMYVYNASTIH